MQDHRRDLMPAVAGTVLEIGAGRGTNFGRLAAGTEWIGLEPLRRRHHRLLQGARDHGLTATVLAAPAESVPLPDASVDTVLSTLVLCSVDDVAATLREVRRVLRPGGRFVFHEHVAAPVGSRTRRWQRIWAPISRRVDHGCDPSRDLADDIRGAGFGRTRIREFTVRAAFGMAVPFITGSAEPARPAAPTEPPEGKTHGRQP